MIWKKVKLFFLIKNLGLLRPVGELFESGRSEFRRFEAECGFDLNNETRSPEENQFLYKATFGSTVTIDSKSRYCSVAPPLNRDFESIEIVHFIMLSELNDMQQKSLFQI